MNDYEKAEKRSFKEYQSSELRVQYAEPSEWLAHKAGFKDGYQLGKAHAEADRDAEMLKTHLKVEHFLSEKRIQLAGMAMQGILANGQSNSAGFIAKKAVSLADALISQLNKNNECSPD